MTAVGILAIVALVCGGCGSGSDSTAPTSSTRSPGVGMGAAIERFKVARRDSGAPAIEPGRHVLGAAPCLGAGSDGVASVELFPELPSPRCLLVGPGERILVVNRTGAFHRRSAVPVTVRLGSYSARLNPQQAAFFPLPVRAFLATGLHGLRVEGGAPGPGVLVVKRRCAPGVRDALKLKPLKRCL